MKRNSEKQLSVYFKGKAEVNDGMEDALWAELFEILGVFESDKGKKN